MRAGKSGGAEPQREMKGRADRGDGSRLGWQRLLFLSMSAVAACQTVRLAAGLVGLVGGPSPNGDGGPTAMVECSPHLAWKAPRPTSPAYTSVSDFYARDGCWHDLSSRVAFFHAGKAGGGSVELSLVTRRIAVSVSHPGPKRHHVRALRGDGPLTTLVVNVRDPADRFVSAFRWRLEHLCRPDDPREGGACPPERKERERDELLMLSVKYGRDPNRLAEGLCPTSPLHEEAVVDHDMIGHARVPLVTWLDFLIGEDAAPDAPSLGRGIEHGHGSNEGGIRSLIAVPMESDATGGSNFDAHVEELSRHLLATKYGPDVAGEILDGAPGVSSRERNRKRHSTRKTRPVPDLDDGAPSSPSSNPALSRLGECCLVRHLAADYRLIRTMLCGPLGDSPAESTGGGTTDATWAAASAVAPLPHVHPVVSTACDWGDEDQRGRCRSDLASLLGRRAKYLLGDSSVCEEAVFG